MLMKTYSIFLGIMLLLFMYRVNYAQETTSLEERIKNYDMQYMYDENRPEPQRIIPAVPSCGENAGKAPSDAIVLFDGSDLSQWLDPKGNEAKWIIGDGYMESVKGSGGVMTKEKFGSCQLHVEWATPTVITGKSQGRGNSGVFLMNTYEIQVLDSYENKTYPPGMASSVYAQSPPLANASLPPGEWQTYDIVFHRPVFDGERVVRPATVTVFHNGGLVQDHYEIMGPTDYKKVPTYRAHPDKMPIGLQDHNNPVRFRNIWIRSLED